jgi:predicted N-acyltransferase
LDTNDFITKKWDEGLFLSSQNEWQKLLVNSDADHFFLSWQWMSQWWINWGSQASDELYIIAIYLNDELVGVAPLYIYESSYLKGRIPIKRLQILGSRYTGSSGIRSEYLGTIVKQGLEIEVNSLISRAVLQNRDWDETVLSDIIQGDYFHQLIIEDAEHNKLRIRKVVSDDCYSVNTDGSFTDYLETLGRNTRLKLFNRRKSLAEHGDVSLEYVDLSNCDDIFQYLNEFHLARYGKAAFTKLNIEILRKVIDSLPETAHLKCSSLLKIDNRPISAIINIFQHGKLYNIQLGFLEDFDKRISLGTLHLGYTIEMAFESAEIESFDLLAGQGKSSNYKSHLAQKHATLESVQILRKPIIRLMYFVNDWLKGNYR